MPGIIRGVARTAVVAGTATAISHRISRRQAGRWAQQEHQQRGHAGRPERQEQRAGAPASQPPPDAGDDDMNARIAQLRELAELRSQGVLTDAEFQAEKRRVLGS